MEKINIILIFILTLLEAQSSEKIKRIMKKFNFKFF